MMTSRNVWRAVPAALLLAAAGLSLPAQAQNPSPTGPGPASRTANQAGEAYPSDPNAANKNKPKLEVLQKAENSRPVQATKRVAKRTKNAVKRTGNRAANAMRNTGEKIGEKIPPGSNDTKK